jgi:hypothetical protein
VVPECLVSNGLSLQPLPLDIPLKVHGVEELLERLFRKIRLDFMDALREEISLA